MMKKSIIGFLLVSLFIFNAEAIGREYEYDAAFEPTKHNIVDQMLTIANVNENDLNENIY